MPATALIVDDHSSFRRFARKLLEAAGFDVVADAEDGTTAVEAVRALRPDVVLLDVLLPDMTGFDVARQLAADRHRPLVVLTSSRTATELGELIHADETGRFITKSELTVAVLAALAEEAA